MNPLHQQLALKRAQVAGSEAAAAANEHLHETYLAKERLPRLRNEAAKLETDIELGEAAHHQLTTALSNLRTMGAGGRELSLAITHAEDAPHRCRLHLGEPLKSD